MGWSGPATGLIEGVFVTIGGGGLISGIGYLK
jgi:threonine dehydratase